MRRGPVSSLLFRAAFVGAIRCGERIHAESAVSATRMGLSPSRALVRARCRSSVFASPTVVGAGQSSPDTAASSPSGATRSSGSASWRPADAVGSRRIQARIVRRRAEREFRCAPSSASVPAGIDSVSRSVENNPGCVWITVNVLWLQHFGSGRSKASGPMSALPQAMGNGSPHKALHGSSAPPSGSPVGADSWRKRKHTGSVTGAARLGRFPSITLARA